MENALLYDWLTVSFVNVDVQTLLQVIGLAGCAWEEQKTGSRLKYQKRIAFDGVSVHYTEDWDFKHNQGVCLEMSGQGCRDFETFGSKDWTALFDFIALTGGKITRLDVAYDDFTGVIPIDIMFEQAKRYYFTARTQKRRLMSESVDGDPAHDGISVCHGSKSSEVYVRCYDKRSERHAWEEFPHWIRFELQLRGSNAEGFAKSSVGLGERFAGVIANYINYRCPDPDDTNKRRWKVCPWWQKFLGNAAALSVHSIKDTEYNKDRLDKHIYERNYNSIKTEILVDGLPAFLHRILGHSAELPSKYSKIVRGSQNADEILAILGETTSTKQVQDLLSEIDDYRDAHAFNSV